jgi:hypothetical protein
LPSKAALVRSTIQRVATVVLSYRGAADRLEAASEQLCVELPGAVLTRKTLTSVEASLQTSQVANLRSSLDWSVGPMVYADTHPHGTTSLG